MRSKLSGLRMKNQRSTSKNLCWSFLEKKSCLRRSENLITCPICNTVAFKYLHSDFIQPLQSLFHAWKHTRNHLPEVMFYSTLTIVTEYGLGDYNLIFSSNKGFFFLPQCLARLWESVSLVSNGYWWLFPRGSSGRCRNLTTHLHLEPKLTNNAWSQISSLPRVLMWFLIKHTDKFTCNFLIHVVQTIKHFDCGGKKDLEVLKDLHVFRPSEHKKAFFGMPSLCPHMYTVTCIRGNMTNNCGFYIG
jgi:hypothetical protein